MRKMNTAYCVCTVFQILNLINSILQHKDTEWLDPLAVFTTSPECIYGVSHIALPTKHRLNDKKYHKASTNCTIDRFTLQKLANVTGWEK